MTVKPMLRAASCIAVAISLSGCQSFVSALGFGPKNGPQRAEASAPIFGSQELERGRMALRGGHPANAIQMFRMAALNPDSAAEAYNGLGVAYAKLGRADLAERYFKMALSMDGTNPRFAANLERFYNSPLANSSRALAMREQDAEAAVAKVADAAQQQGLLEAAPAPQAERRGPVTLERPAVRVARSSGRELHLASTTTTGTAPGTTRPAVAIREPAKAGPDLRKDETLVKQRPRLALATANAGAPNIPVRVNVIRADGTASVTPARPNYPIRIRLNAPKPAE